jgi:hypothetical protein
MEVEGGNSKLPLTFFLLDVVDDNFHVSRQVFFRKVAADVKS